MVIRVQSDHLLAVLLKIYIHTSLATYTPAIVDSSRVETRQFGNVMKRNKKELRDSRKGISVKCSDLSRRIESQFLVN
jgi:hypothetical protein